MTAKSKVAPHLPKPDPTVPADQHGREFCRCGVAIVDGDPRHVLPVVPEQAEVRNRYDHDDEET